MKGPVALAVLAEQELLEEPSGMGAVPFRRAGVRHRLDQLILWRQSSRPALRFTPDVKESFHDILGETSVIERW
jgi:hypothetical protein